MDISRLCVVRYIPNYHFRFWSAGSANHRWPYGRSDFRRYRYSRAFPSYIEFRPYGGFSSTKIRAYQTTCATQRCRIQLFQADAEMDQNTVVRRFSRLLRFGSTVLRHSAIETDRGERAISVGLHRGWRSLHHRWSCTDTIRFIFGRRCHYRGDNGSYITSISNAEPYKHWT